MAILGQWPHDSIQVIFLYGSPLWEVRWWHIKNAPKLNLFQFICSRTFLLLVFPVFSSKTLFYRRGIFLCCNCKRKACTWCRNVNSPTVSVLEGGMLPQCCSNVIWVVIRMLYTSPFPSLALLGRSSNLWMYLAPYSSLLLMLYLFCFAENCFYNFT